MSTTKTKLIIQLRWALNVCVWMLCMNIPY